MDIMHPFYEGLIIGLFIGANAGIVFYGLCIIAKKKWWLDGAQE